MKFIANSFLKRAGTHQLANMVFQETGVQTIDYSQLSYSTLNIWTQTTIRWTILLATPYMLERTKKLKALNPEYEPSFDAFIDVLGVSTFEQAESLIKKIDTLCLKATKEHFPDALIDFLYPPDTGPIEDILSHIIDKGATVNIELLSPMFTTLALNLSSKPKDILKPQTLSHRDMEFIAEFLIYLEKTPKHLDMIVSNIGSDIGTKLMLLSFQPKSDIYLLEWDTQMIQGCFDNLEQSNDILKKDPGAAQAILDSILEDPQA
ncbi:hypothetical protein [Candidatus Synchoanobacter obligatus]|uniref:Uncharacterized protein n=1 Tax=Candidatus Synchoanobacter obligatus TaxID=2919597 RepID=A0ABT1L4Z7_9GAMM|nr:hypothetical protein [Candidatus Synchoanobacter obligatus]MCP8352247.1 hypothetical protein [Candidatus Synchoanobacter obligatus]